MACAGLEQEQLDALFPASKTNQFFEALYGDVNEGPYDIRLVCNEMGPDYVNLAFDLIRRPGKCLACNFTYGLPAVFAKHPIIGSSKLAREIAEMLGWQGEVSWEFLPTRENNENLHSVPFIITRK